MVEYLDFELELGAGSSGSGWPVAVLQSPAGNLRGLLTLPDQPQALARQAQTLAAGDAVTFGRLLFDRLFVVSGIHPAYAESLGVADAFGRALRIKLRILDPTLAAIPWELLHDQRFGEFLALSQETPLVRYLEAAQPLQPLGVMPPLRILGMAVDPTGTIDLGQEKANVERALAPLVQTGAVEVVWLTGGSWRDIQRSLRPDIGPWHIFHFIGHGGLHAGSGEGFLLLADEQGEISPLGAADLGRLLAGHPTLRLALLNACHGAAAGPGGLHTSVAGALIRRGVPAVVAMQFAITQDAAFELSRTFYEAMAADMPLEAALTEARIAASLAHPAGLDWAAPTACLRAADGMLFTVAKRVATHTRPAAGPAEGSMPGLVPPAGHAPTATANPTPGVPNELVEAFNRREVVPFIGAAFAANAGLPDWYTMVAEFARRSNQVMPPPQWANANALIEVTQAYVNQNGVNHLVALLKEWLDTTDIAPSAAHQALAALPIDLVFGAGYDDLVERALRSAGRRVVTVVRDGDIPFMRRSPGIVNVVKLFGDLNQPDTLVVTRQQHERYLLDHPQLVKLLETELGRSTLLYLGWNHGDPQYARLYGEVLARYGNMARLGYAVVFEHAPTQADELRRINVQPLQMLAAPDATASLAAWLKALPAGF